MQKKKEQRSKKSNSSLSSTNSSGESGQKKKGPSLRAHEIVNERSEEQERRHGPFSLGMERTALVASVMCNKELTAEDVYKVLIALKISRIANSVELDSCTDLCGYVEGLYNYHQENDKKVSNSKLKEILNQGISVDLLQYIKNLNSEMK